MRKVEEGVAKEQMKMLQSRQNKDNNNVQFPDAIVTLSLSKNAQGNCEKEKEIGKKD